MWSTTIYEEGQKGKEDMNTVEYLDGKTLDRPGILSHLDVNDCVHYTLNDNIFNYLLISGDYKKFSESVFFYLTSSEDAEESKSYIENIKVILENFFITKNFSEIREFGTFSFHLFDLGFDLDRLLNIELISDNFLENFSRYATIAFNNTLYQNNQIRGVDRINDSLDLLSCLNSCKKKFPALKVDIIKESISIFLCYQVQSSLSSRNYSNITLLFSKWPSIASFFDQSYVRQVFDLIEDHFLSFTCSQDVSSLFFHVGNLRDFFHFKDPEYVQKTYKSIKYIHDNLPYDPYRAKNVVRLSTQKDS